MVCHICHKPILDQHHIFTAIMCNREVTLCNKHGFSLKRINPTVEVKECLSSVKTS
jgi:hypothetical protein